MNVPIIRKIIELGNSKVISLPKSWLEFYEKDVGKHIKHVIMEVNKELKILPYVPKLEKTPQGEEKSNG